MFRGIGASPGIARGKIYVFGGVQDEVPQRKITKDEIPAETVRLEQALLATRQQLLEVQKQISDSIGTQDASIFDAHLLVVEDRTLIEEVIKGMKKDLHNVDYVFDKVAKKYVESLSKIKDDYLRERAADIEDVTKRILRNLLGKDHVDLAHLTEERILVAYDLSPSNTATLDRSKVIGFATDVGSRTSHTAIFARSLEIPAVVGLQDASEKVKSGMSVLIDGYSGLLIVEPSEKTLWEYGQIEIKRHTIEDQLASIRDLPAETADGYRITLSANIEEAADAASVLQHGANGIGLFRTEYIYINRQDVPSEEDQYQEYKTAVEKIAPAAVIIRTLDLGGDKFASSLQVAHDLNPFMGWRAIRFCLARLDLFKAQLRAILRASAHGNAKIMYPMISGVGEVRRANQVLEESKTELRKEGKPFDENISVGVMIEVPSAVITAEIIAEEVDFFSIGTNDLIQYSLAVDRVNEKIAYLYEPTHPAILRLIKQVIEAGHSKGIWVGVCGEMAGEPLLVPLLLGMGIDELSTSPVTVPRIKKIIRTLNLVEARALAKDVMTCTNGTEIMNRAEQFVRRIAPEFLQFNGQQ
ncbi:MAG: phosphoenolpyruvate--protein phosphotransferase [Verrucomicrobiae bacterium]|nr:phosphoenolpyruvate--protein phosphotransferase [Verrucomicrobiae bacterium]